MDLLFLSEKACEAHSRFFVVNMVDSEHLNTVAQVHNHVWLYENHELPEYGFIVVQ